MVKPEKDFLIKQVSILQAEVETARVLKESVEVLIHNCAESLRMIKETERRNRLLAQPDRQACCDCVDL